MIYALIGYLILNQLAYIYILRFANIISSDDIKNYLSSYKGIATMSLIGAPLVLVVFVNAIYEVFNERRGR